MENVNADLFVVKDEDSFRVAGFVPAEYVRESAYIPALLFPKSMIYADVLALTLDKQRKFKRAFLVSDKFDYSGEKRYRILVLKGGRKIGEIFGSLKFTEPKFEIEKTEIVKFGNFWYVYVFVKFIPAAKSHPKFLAIHGSKADTFFPVEISNFLTKYQPRDDFKYRSWYDEWIFVTRFKDFPDTSFSWVFLGDSI